MSAPELDGWSDQTVGDSDGAVVPRVWRSGDRVRIIAGPDLLRGAIGTVLEVDVPGPWPVRVAVSGRRGFGKVLVQPGELVTAPLPDPDARVSCAVGGCWSAAVYLTDACVKHLEQQDARPTQT